MKKVCSVLSTKLDRRNEMKKALLILAVMAACLSPVLGARVTTQPRAAAAPAATATPSMGAMVLPQTDSQKREFAQWQQIYGYGEESHIYYNLAILVKIANQHGQMINSDRQYINMIFNDADPNSLASVVVAQDSAVRELTKENAELKKRVAELEANDPNEVLIDPSLIRGVLDRLNRLENRPGIVWDPNVVLCVDPNEVALDVYPETTVSCLVHNCQICGGDKVNIFAKKFE